MTRPMKLSVAKTCCMLKLPNPNQLNKKKFAEESTTRIYENTPQNLSLC